MNDVDTLRTCLEQIAAEVTPVDLHARVLASARRQTLRRTAAGVATAVAATVAALAVAVSLQPAAGPSPAPSATPSEVAPQPTTLPGYVDPHAPDPGIGPFTDATVTVPPWGPGSSGCATGRVKIVNGQYLPPSGRAINVLSSITTDVDGDGTADYVAHLTCGEGPESPGGQIVAFRRAGTRLEPIGRVIGTQDGLAMVESVEARGGGKIAVQVAAAYTDSGIQWVPNQWRVYALQGGKFRQVAGPTSFPANPPAAALSVAASPLTFARAGSQYVGDLTITVANTGALDVASAELDILLPFQARPAGDGWSGCATAYDQEVLAVRCTLTGLTAGSTRPLHLRFLAATVPVRGNEPIGPENHDHYVTLGQLPPVVFEHDTDVLEAPFAVVGP